MSRDIIIFTCLQSVQKKGGLTLLSIMLRDTGFLLLEDKSDSTLFKVHRHGGGLKGGSNLKEKQKAV